VEVAQVLEILRISELLVSYHQSQSTCVWTTTSIPSILDNL